MRELLNVLYVMTQGASLSLEHDTVRVAVERETRLRAPLLRLNGIVVFGQVNVSPFLLHRCAEDGRSLVWLNRNGRFKARLQGRTRGNVLLRRAQHLALSDKDRPALIARQIVAAKIQNSRQLVLRAARDTPNLESRAWLSAAAERLAEILVRLKDCADLDSVRGAEGEAAHVYFRAFGYMLRGDRGAFGFSGRSRRPPLDRPNALLSFLYALLQSECASALEGVGLDPMVGYLHALRPGRPALALDLMEEFRPVLADRLVLALVNRRELRGEHLEQIPGGAFRLTDDGRRAVLVAYQKRKEEVVHHRLLDEKVPLGLVPHVQARLLARHLRGDLKDYPPFVYRQGGSR
ncbi:MAG: type I-C CRISPR-associated endonuclease Cas1c [Anaerolineae bacterium]